MLISELAKAVHDNAVEHGWWDDKREAPEIIALVHSEWSEALEEARAGRPMAYIAVETGSQRDPVTSIIPRNEEGKYVAPWGMEYHGKPEGVAVELIDGCIRILDYMGEMGVEIQDNDTGAYSEFDGLYSEDFIDEPLQPVAHLIANLHKLTSDALTYDEIIGSVNPFKLLCTMALALSWVKWYGLDPLALLLEKHEYNKSRPYKHGKKF